MFLVILTQNLPNNYAKLKLRLIVTIKKLIHIQDYNINNTIKKFHADNNKIHIPICKVRYL